MSVFALVHGAGHGAWCWERLTPLLAAAGHRIVAVDLPTADPAAGAVRYADLVAEALAGAGDDVVLVGHSLAGLTIPLVAARRPVRHLVYLSALLPRPGEAPFGTDPAAPPETAPGFRIERLPDGTFAFPRDIARRYLYGCCSDTDAEWAIARLRPQSTAPHQEVCPLDVLPAVPSTYVAGREDRTVLLAHATYLARVRLGLEPVAIDADHSAFLSAPAALAEVLVTIAA